MPNDTFPPHNPIIYIIRIIQSLPNDTLKGLNNNFRTLRSQIVLIHPFSNIDRALLYVYTMNGSLEKLKVLTPLRTIFLSTTSVPQAKAVPTKQTTFVHSMWCSKPLIEKTYKKHSYPPGYKHKNKSAVGSVSYVERRTGTNIPNHQTESTQSLLLFFLSLMTNISSYWSHSAENTNSHSAALTSTFPSFSDMACKFLCSPPTICLIHSR